MSNHIRLVVTDVYGERLAKAASALIGRWDRFGEPGRSYSAVELLGKKALERPGAPDPTPN